jgi:pimeloyl-ACP methyl ester carboxylesterase
MSISHWASARAADAYRAAYADSLRLWPIPYRTRCVETSFGRTHVVESGQEDGEPIVLIHAASLSATQWYLQAAELGRDHRLLAIDILGDIGLSEQAAPMRTRSEAAGWLAATLDGLGIERARFVGSSFGGFLSANLAALRPGRVGALVLLAPAATLRPFKLAANLMIRAGSLLPLPMTVKPGLRGMMQGALPDPSIVRQMEAGVRGFRYDRRGIYPTELPDADLASITCPTLVLLGDREMIYDAERAADRAWRLLPDREVAVIPGVGHLLGMQDPVRVNAWIRAFLRAKAPPARGVASATVPAVADAVGAPVAAGVAR